MAQRKISELPSLSTPDGAEELVVNDSGVSKKVTIANAVANTTPKIHTHTVSNITDAGNTATLDLGTISGTVSEGDHAHTGIYEAADVTILKDADIGVNVQAYDATIVVDADIGSTVQAYDATIVVDADIGVNVQAYDATIVVDADIGSTVQAYDADTAKTDTAQEWTSQQNFNATTLTFDATQDWDLTTNQVCKLTLTANTTFDAPTNQVDGSVYVITIIQDGTGSRTAGWNTVFKWAGGTAPTLTTDASAKDVFTFVSDGTNMNNVAQVLDVS